MSGQLSPHSTTATVATLSTVLALVTCYSLFPRAVAAFQSTDVTPSGDSKADSKDKSDTKDKKKHYEVKREFYSPSTGRWEVREEDEAKNDELLFTVKHRVWPKSTEFQGHDDYTCLEIQSQSLIDALRLELKEVEEAFEDSPSVDSKDVFLHITELRLALEGKKKEIDVLAAKEHTDASSSAPTGDATPVSNSAAKDSVAPTAEPNAEEKEDGKVSEKGKDEVDDEGLGTVPVVPKTLGELKVEVEHLGVLVDFVDTLFAPVKAKLDRLLADSVISYNLLWAIFTPGNDSYVQATDDVSGEKFAFKLKSSSYTLSREGPVFAISGTKIVWTGTRYARTWYDTQIPKFKGMRKISSLFAHPLSEAQREELTARGRIYCGLARVAFMTYSGSLIQVIGSGMERRIVKLRAEGRAVVDARGYARMNPSQNNDPWDDDDSDFAPGEDTNPGSGVGKEVLEKELCLLPPCVFGFSLIQREWGQMLVNEFTEVVFNDAAWDYLVIDPDQKALVKSLVEQNSKQAQERAIELAATAHATHRADTKADFVAGKGGGLVVALHGRPGTGKTLTAEAIAELLHVPLYAIGAGELGVQADIMEKRLRDVLDVGGSWGAVLLIDECDVMMEERSLHDVSRNAMVSVFLRLLEYHSGILILTTNRIRTVDPAFLSRFSLAITYPDLSVAKRRTIWTTFLHRAGAVVEERSTKKALANGSNGTGSSSTSGTSTPVPAISAKYLDKLAFKEFNGRSIKNTVRTASALALSKGVLLAEEHLDIVVKVSETFLSDIKEPDEDSVYDAAGEGWKSRTNVYS